MMDLKEVRVYLLTYIPVCSPDCLEHSLSFSKHLTFVTQVMSLDYAFLALLPDLWGYRPSALKESRYNFKDTVHVLGLFLKRLMSGGSKSGFFQQQPC